jgi:hypothetical protein
MQMWTQLNLFDKQTEVEYAMSLTSDELQSIKLEVSEYVNTIFEEKNLLNQLEQHIHG